jgi:siroheme synthase
MAQEAISALVVERGLAGQAVVLLKGGDPFVFGRGAEEALACAEVGVPFEVVPGVSSAHGDGIDLSEVAVATDTLVLLMVAGRLEATCAELVAAGRPADEPAAIVQWAWTPEQRSVVGTLSTLPALAIVASIGPPATLVVGAVAALGDQLASSEAISSNEAIVSPLQSSGSGLSISADTSGSLINTGRIPTAAAPESSR